MTDDATTQQQPKPDPALRQLDFLVGRWSMKGHLVGSDEENVVGEATYEWLPGGFNVPYDTGGERIGRED
jgi:hypothetical protein